MGGEELDNVGLVATVIPASCLENARMVLAVNGSVDDYNFSIEPAAGTMENAPNVYEDLPTGIYQVTATLIDNASCNQTIEVEVMEEGVNNIGVTATASPVSCANNGQIEIVVAGDPENYTYTINPEVGTNTTAENIFEDLPAGTYQVIATLTNNPQCFQTIEIEVEQEELDNAGLTATPTPVTCSGNGQIELAVNGAIEDFLFSIEPSANIESTAPNLFTEVPTGIYQVTATSVNNPLCTQMIDVEVRQDTLDGVGLTATPTPVTCSGNGQVKVSVSGVIENYTFSIAPSEGVIQSTPTLFENLSAGIYQITALTLSLIHI